MNRDTLKPGTLPRVFWGLATLAILIWSFVPHYVVGWDLQVYRNAAHALRLGHDPYVDGMAVQEIYHRTKALHPNDPPPYTYVYSPVTLPVLRAANKLPHLLTLTVYWVLYFTALLSAIWVGLQMTEDGERRLLALAAPAAVFFPGLLQQDCFFSGNVAYIVYGALFCTALLGWRRNDWRWFYPVVLLASLCKAPFLSLLAIPILSARRQWLPVVVTGVLGIGLFAMQPFVWPEGFRHYLQAVELQFSYNHDFSSSPAGLLADRLYYVIPYKTTSAVFYCIYAALFLAILVYLSRRYLSGALGQKQWIPVLLVGVILLNPRIMEYDVAPITLVMALVLWRFFASFNTRKGTILWCAATFTIINIGAVAGWRTTECLTLVGTFFAGAWTLHKQSRGAESRQLAPDHNSLEYERGPGPVLSL